MPLEIYESSPSLPIRKYPVSAEANKPSFNEPNAIAPRTSATWGLPNGKSTPSRTPQKSSWPSSNGRIGISRLYRSPRLYDDLGLLDDRARQGSDHHLIFICSWYTERIWRRRRRSTKSA